MAAVLFADLVGYSRKSVAEQQTTKDSFRDLLQSVVAAVPEEARTMVDTGDGAAIAFLRDPEHALYTALRLRHTLEAAPHVERRLQPEELRIGINLGPVRRAVDVNGRPNLIGDGMNAAERVMSFASPGHTTSSRSFRDALERLHSSYTDLFEPLGVRADKHGREHEIFRICASPSALSAATTSLQLMGGGGAPAASSESVTGSGHQHRAVALVAFVVAVAAPLLWLALQRGIERSPIPAEGPRPQPAAEPVTSPPVPVPTETKPAEVRSAESNLADSQPGQPSAEPTASAVSDPVPGPSLEPKGAPAARPARKGREAQEPTVRPEPREASPRCRNLTQKASVGDISREESDELRRTCR